MPSGRIFQIALLISLAVHGVIMLQNHNFNILPTIKKEENLEVSYIKKEEGKPIKRIKVDGVRRDEPLLKKMPSKITADWNMPLPFIDRQNLMKRKGKYITAEPTFKKPALIKPDVIAIKKKITLPPIDMDNINNPSYISYYQIVREKIRRAAYNNYIGTDTGQVCVLFVVSYEGCLREARLAEDKSSPSMYLKEIALKSIKDATPFPKFPKELDYPQLSFRLDIAFNIE